MQMLKWLAYLFVGLLSLGLIGLQAYKIGLRIATRIETPNGISSLYFFEGKFDMANPTIIVEDFCNSLEDGKDIHLVIFEGSAHLPMIEEREKYENLLIGLRSIESQDK